jgi:transposase
VAPSTVGRLFARYRATGSVNPAPQGRERGRGKLGPHRDYVIACVKEKPDITMPELAAMLSAERGVLVDPSNISKLLCAAGFTYKKNAAGVGTRTQRRAGGAY